MQADITKKNETACHGNFAHGLTITFVNLMKSITCAHVEKCERYIIQNPYTLVLGVVFQFHYNLPAYW